MVTEAKIKKACRQANWDALHATRFEYRVVVNEGNEVEVQERVQGDIMYRPGEIILKTYCYWRHPVVAIKRMQSQFIKNQLDEDAAECWEEYQKEKEV